MPTPMPVLVLVAKSRHPSLGSTNRPDTQTRSSCLSVKTASESETTASAGSPSLLKLVSAFKPRQPAALRRLTPAVIHPSAQTRPDPRI